jgi:hypothetical protein
MIALIPPFFRYYPLNAQKNVYTDMPITANLPT